jgi:peptidoglycan/LPS O-acetylase OafA/YrhL
MITIGQRWEVLKGRPSGFDYMRIVLSSCVLIWHSYQVAYGTDEAIRFWKESLVGWFLPIILPIFFALSGFLVAGSMYRNSNLRTFLTLRVIRIFPALVVEVALAGLILGPFLTTMRLSEYFTSPIFYKYFLNMVGYIHYLLPGVFEHNPERGTVNSQLWTVPFELECYVAISIVAILGMFRDIRLVFPFFILATVFLVSHNIYRDIDPAPAGGVSGRLLVLCFFAGVVIYSFRNMIPLSSMMAAGSILLSIILIRLRYTSYITPILFAYFTTYIGLLNPKRSIIVRSGDYSYGLYLYSCPIQQTVAVLLGIHLTFVLNLAISFPIAVVFALFSWWCIEKPFLKVRRFVGARPAPTPARADSIN